MSGGLACGTCMHAHFSSCSLFCICRSVGRADFGRLPGIHDANSIAVTFNVIVPQMFWLWDEKTEMHLRFGDRRLGSFGVDVGTFKCHR